MKAIFGIITMSFFLSACSNNVNQSNNQEVEETDSKKYPSIFEKSLAAHGSLEKWKSYGSLTFNELSGSDTTIYIVDLKNRNELIEKKGAYKIGFTADSIRIYPDANSFPGKNPRFYQNLIFYFFAIHFVTADDGTIQEELEPKELNGETYNRVKITFHDGVGYSSKDQYILWFEQTTNILKMINYSVTYYDESRAEKYSAIVFDKWTEVDGLKMPAEMIGYKWENDSLGEQRYIRSFENISFSTQRPNPSVFEVLFE